MSDTLNLLKLPVLPLKNIVLFPKLVLPLSVGRDASRAAVESAIKDHEGELILIAQRDSNVETPGPEDLHSFGIIDDIIPEPLGGAHRDQAGMANTLKTHLLRYLRELKTVPLADLLEQRYQKFRRLGVFEQRIASPDGATAAGAG